MSNNNNEQEKYKSVMNGKLKLKGLKIKKGTCVKIKKTEKIKQNMITLATTENATNEEILIKDDNRTEAQKRFDEVQAQRKTERIAKAATKTHRQRIEELNKFLDTLSNHFDIPKVGPG
eukprot:TRINITY_DN1564_c3_g1_i1.p1 TRINITY_DN1564_c3_g1~~TRINITY_DN1564_c3_g1_i1.p1  ORF type:complete len:119 (+),score=56.43 TRINITY_DN1564_c3_g1_i1:49-405(+)